MLIKNQKKQHQKLMKALLKESAQDWNTPRQELGKDMAMWKQVFLQ